MKLLFEIADEVRSLQGDLELYKSRAAGYELLVNEVVDELKLAEDLTPARRLTAMKSAREKLLQIVRW